MEDLGSKWILGIIIVIIFIGGLIWLGMWGIPQYELYSRSLDGKANLMKEEFERQIMVEDAKAKMESSKLLAKAEVERAKGVAEANKIIGDSLKGNDAYLRYLWIQGLQDGSSEVIYVPTEANLPILEATRKIKIQPQSNITP